MRLLTSVDVITVLTFGLQLRTLRSMGRKPKAEGATRPHQITVRLSDEEYQALRAALDAIEARAGLPIQLADWVRRAIHEQLRKERGV